MTTYQILAIVAVAAVAAWQYVPWKSLHLPSRQPSVMGDIAAVVRIRESRKSPDVTEACNELLRVLLDTK